MNLITVIASTRHKPDPGESRHWKLSLISLNHLVMAREADGSPEVTDVVLEGSGDYVQLSVLMPLAEFSKRIGVE